MHYYSKLYVSDICTLKKYNDNTYKLTYHKMPIKQKGFETNHKVERIIGVNQDKLDNNISRSKSKVLEYALCNEFKYFVTLTINPKLYDRFDLKTYYKDFGVFLKNYNRKYKTKVQYLFIPETHQNGAWHMHGLISGVLHEHLEVNENGYLDFPQYKKQFGYISLGLIKNQGACAKYITKYVSKDMDKSIKELNAHSFYKSNGLKKAVEIKKGMLSRNNTPFEYENEYVKIAWFENESIALNTIFD